MQNRLSAILTNVTIVQKVFERFAQIELEILCFINDYNHYINSVNLANKFRQVYNTQQIVYQT
jgi:hypothetical protein